MKTKMYNKVNVYNSGKMVDIDLEEENFIYLKPQKQGTFNRYNMAKFQSRTMVKCSQRK